MKHFLTAAAAIALISVTGSALAQAPAPAPAPAVPGAIAPAPDVMADTIVAALANTQTEVGELASVSASASIELVELSDYLGGPDATRINAALTASEAERDALHTALEGNAAIMAALQSDVKIDNVVAVDVSGDKILIFWQPTTDAGAGAAPGGGAAGGGAAPPAGGM